jgi:hypothetical protein
MTAKERRRVAQNGIAITEAEIASFRATPFFSNHFYIMVLAPNAYSIEKSILHMVDLQMKIQSNLMTRMHVIA